MKLTKLFISLQVLTAAAAAVAGMMIRSSVPDAGIAGARHYEDLKAIDFDCIVTADTAPESAFGEGPELYDGSYSKAMFICTAEDCFVCANGIYRQSICIEKPISGICPAAGESIRLTVDGGARRMPKEQYRFNNTLDPAMPDGQLLTVLDLSGANYMIPGHRYLVSCLTRKLGAVRYYGTARGRISWLGLADSPDEFFCTTEAARSRIQAWKKKQLEKYGALPQSPDICLY